MSAPDTPVDAGPFRVAGPGGREYPGPKAPPNVDLDACPIWPCNDPKAVAAQQACGTWEPCGHDRRTLIGEIARLRAVVGWVQANDHVHTWQVSKRLGKEYGRASAEIARLRGENARLRTEERDYVRRLRERVERYRQIARGTRIDLEDPVPIADVWAQELEDTAEMAGGFTEPERNGLRAAARMMRDADVRARVHSTIGGGS